MNFIKRLFREWFTGPNSSEFELARLLFAAAIVSGIGLHAYSIFRGGAFSMSDYGVGMAALMAGGGIGVAAKDTGAAKAVATAAA